MRLITEFIVRHPKLTAIALLSFGPIGYGVPEGHYQLIQAVNDKDKAYQVLNDAMLTQANFGSNISYNCSFIHGYLRDGFRFSALNKNGHHQTGEICLRIDGEYEIKLDEPVL